MKELSSFSGSQAPLNCAAWHPIHEDVFVTGGHDGTILFWCASRSDIQVSPEPVWPVNTDILHGSSEYIA